MTKAISNSDNDIDLHGRLGSILGRSFQINANNLQESTELASLGIDSLSLVELANSVETEFGVPVDDKAIENLKTFGDLVAHISLSLPENVGTGTQR